MNPIDQELAVESLADLFSGQRKGLELMEMSKLATAFSRHQPSQLLGAAARQWRKTDPDAATKLRSLFEL